MRLSILHEIEKPLFMEGEVLAHLLNETVSVVGLLKLRHRVVQDAFDNERIRTELARLVAVVRRRSCKVQFRTPESLSSFVLFFVQEFVRCKRCKRSTASTVRSKA